MTVSAVCLIAGLAFLALAWKLDREVALAFRNWMAVASWSWHIKSWAGRYYRRSCTCDRWASGAALLGLVLLVIAVVCGLAIF